MICFTATLTGFLKKICKRPARFFRAGKTAAEGGEKHARRAAPVGAKLSERKVSKFFALLFVLYKKQEKAAKPQKDLILFARICCFGALIRGLQNLNILCNGNELSLFASCKK